jgi:hypothetical protein
MYYVYIQEVISAGEEEGVKTVGAAGNDPIYLFVLASQNMPTGVGSRTTNQPGRAGAE